MSHAFRHGERFLTANRVWNPAGFRFHDRLAGLMWHSASALFRDHAADLVRNLLHMRFADGSAGSYGNMFDQFLRHHATNLVRNLCHNGLGDHATDRDRHRLATDLWLIGRTGNLATNDVRTPDATSRTEAGHLRHANLRATAWAGNQSRAARAGMIDLLLTPVTAVLLDSAIGCDGLHHSVAAFLVDDFSLLSHDNLTTFTLQRLGHRTLNTTAYFTSRVVPDESLSRVGLIAIQCFGDGAHHRVSFFTVGRFIDLARDLVLLFAIRDFADRAVASFLHVFVGRFIHRPADCVLLRLLHGVIHRALAHLPLDATGRVTARLARGRRTTPVTGCSAITPGKYGSR